MYSRQERKREHERNRQRPSRQKAVRAFSGFDGEGWTVDGSHELMILRAGDSELYTGKPLEITEIFDWLVELPRNVYYVGYSLGYDLSMILRQLPKERFLRLYMRERRTNGNVVYPIDWRDTYRIEWIPKKRFSVWLASDNKKRFDVEDVVGCFQKSFANAIRDWEVGEPAELEVIDSFKAKRSAFADEDVDAIREYNRLECVLLARMMEKVRVAAGDAEIRPTSWYGAGQLAQALLRSKRVKENMRSDFTDGFTDAVGQAYFGGWFDVSQVGLFDEMYEYDISSAYPHAMRSLPCLAHSKIVNYPVEGCDQLCLVEWATTGRNVDWGAFPLRHGSSEWASLREGRGKFIPGTLWYPRRGRGWYWRREVDAVERRGTYNVKILNTWSIVRECKCKPFSWVDSLYEERRRLGKSGKGMVLKLALNSLYGKLAQTRGRPQFRSLVWAGLITSSTRAALHDAIRRGGETNVVMTATDAVYSRAPIEGLRMGSGLGEWEAVEHGQYLIVQPGLHYSFDLNKFRTRGIPAHVVERGLQGLQDHWLGEHRWEPYAFELTMFYTPQYAYQLRQPKLMGQWETVKRGVRFGSTDKRIIPRVSNGERSERLSLLSNEDDYRSADSSVWERATREVLEQRNPYGVLAGDQPDWVDPLEGVLFGEPV